MSAEGPGPGQALRRVGATVLAMLHSRIELASLEARESAAHWVQWLVAALAATLLVGGAVAALSAWLAVALWPLLGHWVLGCLALAYALAGGAVLGWLRQRVLAEPAPLSQTLAELRVDAAVLRGERAAQAARDAREQRSHPS